jgi:class 3 adenylate cyclase
MAVSEALADVVAAFEGTGWAVEVADPAWRFAWASPEMLTILGASQGEEIGVGRHIVESRRLPAFRGVSSGGGAAWLRTHVPFMLADGVTREEILALADPRAHELIRGLEPSPAPPRWSFTLPMRSGSLSALGERIVDADGRLLGTAFIFGSGLPASLLSFVARGDAGMFQRMQQLSDPGRRQAAILFADLEGSTDLSRRMSSARYFAFVRDLMMAVDEAILREEGIVAQHAGDGVVAFFLADQVGSPSAAARAALAAAREVHRAADRLEPGCRMAVGVHWGATLYMGQVATSGRLEVTALGDEVNECARIQEAARGGTLLASKPLLERLDDGDAAALGLSPVELVYRLVAELPDVPEKARRDAGSVAVVAL